MFVLSASSMCMSRSVFADTLVSVHVSPSLVYGGFCEPGDRNFLLEWWRAKSV